MNGVPVDTRSDEFQTMYQNFIAYPSSIILETQAELDKIISEELENDIRSERHELGPCYALERLQRALIIMQNKLWSKRVQINKELSDIIAKPLRSNRQVMELSERLDVLLGMKERANGAYCRAYDYDTAISIVNSQTESETAAPYATEQSHLDLSRLLSDMDREIELGNNIKTSPICLHGSGMFSHQSRRSRMMLLFIKLSSPPLCARPRGTYPAGVSRRISPMMPRALGTARPSAGMTTSKENQNPGNGCSEL